MHLFEKTYSYNNRKFTYKKCTKQIDGTEIQLIFANKFDTGKRTLNSGKSLIYKFLH